MPTYFTGARRTAGILVAHAALNGAGTRHTKRFVVYTTVSNRAFVTVVTGETRPANALSRNLSAKITIFDWRENKATRSREQKRDTEHAVDCCSLVMIQNTDTVDQVLCIIPRTHGINALTS